MERGENPSDLFDNIDADDGVMVNPTPLSAPFVVNPKPNYCRDEYEMEGGNSDGRNIDSGNNMGIFEIPSSEDNNPNDMSFREGTDIIVPIVGIKFQDENEVFEFYKNYAYQVRFSVRKRNSRKGEYGVVHYVTFTCSQEGHRTSGSNSILKPQPTIQTGCKARLTACSEFSGAWPIVEASGYENIMCVEKDCRNFIDKVRRLRLSEGDALAIQAYFTKIQATSLGFFFSIDLDDEARLWNVFWADNRCRQACEEFSDIVTFDTTYLTNKYEMPFSPFVRVNHHGQSTLLGCGLLSNEDTRTFVWLFETWLECMHAQAPCGIITDQDRAMQNVIEIVSCLNFPILSIKFKASVHSIVDQGTSWAEKYPKIRTLLCCKVRHRGAVMHLYAGVAVSFYSGNCGAQLTAVNSLFVGHRGT
ncbi:protein FAR1-RELATED SEQUENCE 3-like [Olea europaea var. sylvestris]|uniref:protein FAR1-RELATED SEQUENCE 3-like n=1 Tax=Olea europaea var. sylvestris TaxID=158386 RepID=UPI000C1D7F78|nr:protein FAR1-RELATED SEQUENCE 3-like [Olea europaea var. sylvestris]